MSPTHPLIGHLDLKIKLKNCKATQPLVGLDPVGKVLCWRLRRVDQSNQSGGASFERRGDHWPESEPLGAFHFLGHGQEAEAGHPAIDIFHGETFHIDFQI